MLSLGCAKNQVESEHIAGMLIADGWQAQPSPHEAEVLLVNTCGFLQEAVEENLAAIMDLAQAKQDGQRLVVVGCLVGRYGKKLAASLNEADLLIAPGEVHNLLDILDDPDSTNRLAISRPRRVFGEADPRALSTSPGWAYLRVADGCDRRCAFCTIGAIRGRLRSRGIDDVVSEAKRMVAGGVVELNLVAQDLTAYGDDLGPGDNLAALLARLNSIKSLRWVRALYLHPDYLERELVQTIASLERVVPYFDLPFQHADDTVLAAMGRKRSSSELRELIFMIRELVPEATMRATLITGHPGEGPEQFDRLVKFVEDVRLDHLGCFAYSPEPGTRSARLDAPDSAEASHRRDIIMELARKISREKLTAMVGQEQDILVLGEHPESELLGQGRLASQAPEVDGEVIIVDGQAQPGTMARCRITKSHDYDLEASLVTG